MITKDEIIKIGKLQKSYGIKGEISLVFDKPAYADIDTEFYFLDIDGIFVPFLIEEITFITDTGARVKFEDIDDETRAAQFANLHVFFKQIGNSTTKIDWNFLSATLFYRVLAKFRLIESADSATLNVLLSKPETELPIRQQNILSSKSTMIRK